MSSTVERPGRSASVAPADEVLDPAAATRVVTRPEGLRLVAPDGAVLMLAAPESGLTSPDTAQELSRRAIQALGRRASQRRTQAWAEGRVLLSIDDDAVRTHLHDLLQYAGAESLLMTPVDPPSEQGPPAPAVDPVHGDVLVLARLRSTGPPEDGWDGGRLARLPRVRAHREGDRVLVLPAASGEPDDVTVASVRSRRLAASADRGVLADSWSLNPKPLPLPQVAALRVAHLLMERVDLLAGHATTPADTRARAVARRTQVSLDLASLRTARHSVLSVPAPASLP